jgi:hypothetical protein
MTFRPLYRSGSSPTVLEAKWVPETFWTFWRREGIGTPNRPARSPVAIPTTLSADLPSGTPVSYVQKVPTNLVKIQTLSDITSK